MTLHSTALFASSKSDSAFDDLSASLGDPRPNPTEDALVQLGRALMTELVDVISDTALEDFQTILGEALIGAFHSAAGRIERDADRARDTMRSLERDFDGSEAADVELQEATARARAGDAATQAAELIRDAASGTWTIATGEVWTAWRGSRRGSFLTAAQLEAKQAIRAVRNRRAGEQDPGGPIVAFRGAPTANTREDAGRIFDALNWAKQEWPDMALAAAVPSRSDGFQGGMQVFVWSPGRVFEVWTAPLRVTTLTLGEGETLTAKAAGDTVRWQIGEAVSGEGPRRRVHVMLKPLERGLETNLVLTTNQRVYLIDLKSGGPDAFNTAVAWDTPTPAFAPSDAGALRAETRVPDPVVMPEGPLDARYRVEPQGRRPRWTPNAVFNDGRRTFIAFDPDLQVDEAPALFVIAADGEPQLTNYRQVGGLYVVDRVFDRAELRLGDRRPQIVRIRRLEGTRP